MITLGTRGSDLAMWQAHHIRDLLAERAGAEVEIVVIHTEGDRDQATSLAALPGKGFFTKEIEEALLAGRIDVAVHSHKDLPTESPVGLEIVAVPERGPVEDCLLVRPDAWRDPEGDDWIPVREGAVVGTGSARRGSQLRAARPDLDIRDLRGNVPTRVRKVVEGRYDAIVLANAGLQRLQLDVADLRVCTFAPTLFVPAPAQGALGVQMRAGDSCRESDAAVRDILACLHDEATMTAIGAERALLASLEGGCNLPLGAWARLVSTEAGTTEIELTAVLGTDDGDLRRCVLRGDEPAAVATVAREQLLAD